MSFAGIVTAVVLALPAPSASAQGLVGRARPTPPPITANVTNPRCSYGGAVPAIVITFDFEATAAVTGLSAATLYLRIASGRTVSGVRGPLTLRQRPASAPGAPIAMPLPFTGQVGAGQRVRLEVFGQLETAAFHGASYPNAELPFELALTAGSAVLHVRGGPCTITPAG